jgi:hypothetical protein
LPQSPEQKLYDQQKYQKNKEKIKARVMRHYYANRQKKIAYALEYQKKHKDLKRIWSNNDRRRVRRELLTLLGDKCAVCSTLKRIEIDHKLAGGSKDRLDRGNNHDMYRYYLKHPEEAKEKLQLLCKEHNLDKEFANHERHK